MIHRCSWSRSGRGPKRFHGWSRDSQAEAEFVSWSVAAGSSSRAQKNSGSARRDLIGEGLEEFSRSYRGFVLGAVSGSASVVPGLRKRLSLLKPGCEETRDHRPSPAPELRTSGGREWRLFDGYSRREYPRAFIAAHGVREGLLKESCRARRGVFVGRTISPGVGLPRKAVPVVRGLSLGRGCSTRQHCRRL